MTARRKVSSGAPWESVVGYSRAVAAGDNIWVTGCTSLVDGEVVHEGDPYAQTAQAIRNVAWALGQLDSSLEDVVRTRIFVTDISRWEEYGRAHGEAFGEIMPATSMVEVSALIDPRMMVEVEAVAYKPGVRLVTSTGLAVRVIPCLDVDAGPGGQGRQLHRPARRRRPGRDGDGLRRRGRRRADVPRHHGVLGCPRDDL